MLNEGYYVFELRKKVEILEERVECLENTLKFNKECTEAKNKMRDLSVKGIKAQEAAERNRKRMEERRKKEEDYAKLQT